MTLGRCLLVGGLLMVFGCDDASADGAASGDTDVISDDMPDGFPAGSCAETMGEDCETDGAGSGSADDTGSTSGAPGDCMVEGCVGQGVCAAPWDQEAEVRGEFECQFACIPTLDDASWCANDDACCDAGARCTERGYCVLDGDGESTGTGGDTGTDTDTDTDTDGATGGSTTGGGA